MEKDKTFHISWWHIAYLCVIFLIIIIALIVCMSRESVSDAAMDNVSFASSIVSIVLAVVSIVVSLYATFSTSANLGSMQDVARGIRRSLNRLRSIKNVAEDNNRRLEEIKSGMLQKATPEEIRRKQIEEQVEEQVDADKSVDGETPPVASAPQEPAVESETSENSVAASAAQSPSAETTTGAESNSSKQQPAPTMLTPNEMADVENLAISKVGSILGLSNIMRDYNLRTDNASYMFDGVYHSPFGGYTFIEVTTVPRASMPIVNMRLSRFRHQILDLLEKMRPGNNHIYYVVVFRNNDKDAIISRIPSSRHSLILRDTPYLTILYLNLDEL